MLNLSWVCFPAISNRKVQNAFLPICLFVLSQIMPHYLQRFGPIAGFRLLGKKVILISCHAKITIRKQKLVFHSDQRCASVSNSGKRRKSAWTLLLSASIPFVLPWIFNHLLNHFVCADTVCYHSIPLAVSSKSLQSSKVRVSCFHLKSIKVQIFRHTMKLLVCSSHKPMPLVCGLIHGQI